MKDLQPIQRRIAKDLQITKLGDDQERRAKWRKTEGRERLSSTKKIVDEDSQESSIAKTCSSYEKKPARIKKIPKKQRQLLKQVPTRKPARKGKGVRGQRGLHLQPGITALLEDDPKNSAKRDGGKK